MMKIPNVKPLENLRFGLLTVTEFVGVKPNKQAVWRAVCDCDGVVIVSARELISGDTKSCGCLKAAANRARNKASAKHNSSNSPEYRSWRGAIDRCYNPRGKDYIRYGGRGITVAPEWRHNFQQFLADMKLKPSAQHSLERIDVNGPYSPNNCKWALPSEQQKNRRCVTLHEGKLAQEWATALGVTTGAIYKRLKNYGSVYGNPRR